MPLLQTKPHNRFALLRDTAPARDVVLQRMDLVAKLLDSAFVLPGINRRVGIDAILGLVPGIGDLVTTLLSSYIIWEARNLEVALRAGANARKPRHPRVSWLCPAGRRRFRRILQVNQRNMRIVRAHLDRA
jgi:hypothetical protein